jgi:hypothetical protein
MGRSSVPDRELTLTFQADAWKVIHEMAVCTKAQDLGDFLVKLLAQKGFRVLSSSPGGGFNYKLRFSAQESEKLNKAAKKRPGRDHSGFLRELIAKEHIRLQRKGIVPRYVESARSDTVQ